MVSRVWLILVMLLVSSVSGQEHVQLSLGRVSEVYTVPCNEYKYFTVEATEQCMDLRVKVNGIEGESDLVISRGPQKYPKFNSLAWSSYNWGSEDLTISSWDPEYVVGTYYIGVMSFCGEHVSTGNTPAKITVLVEHVPSIHPHDEILPGMSIAGNIAANAYRYYRFCLPHSCSNVIVSLDNCLDPVTCPTSYSYPDLLVSRSAQTPTINHHSWKLASSEFRSVPISHDDPDLYPGHYFVAVYGWCTPDDLCPDPSTCSPCSYANNTEFVVTLSVTDVTEGCTPKEPRELCSVGGGMKLIVPNVVLFVLPLFSFIL